MQQIRRLPYGEVLAGPVKINECPICMKVFEENENVVQLQCHKTHIFHDDCLEKWLE